MLPPLACPMSDKFRWPARSATAIFVSAQIGATTILAWSAGLMILPHACRPSPRPSRLARQRLINRRASRDRVLLESLRQAWECRSRLRPPGASFSFYARYRSGFAGDAEDEIHSRHAPAQL